MHRRGDIILTVFSQLVQEHLLRREESNVRERLWGRPMCTWQGVVGNAWNPDTPGLCCFSEHSMGVGVCVCGIERLQTFSRKESTGELYWLQGTVVAKVRAGRGRVMCTDPAPSHMTRIVTLPQNKAQHTGRTHSRLHHSGQRCLRALQNLRLLSERQPQSRQHTPWGPCHSLPTEDVSTG